MTTCSPVELTLGTVQFGLAYGIAGRGQAIPAAEARAILLRAAQLGIKRLDTAPAYGDIEQRLAGLCAGLQFAVTSKIPALPDGCSAGDAGEFVRASLNQSRDRLGDMLAGILFHRSDDLDDGVGDAIWQVAEDWCIAQAVSLGISCYDPQSVSRLAHRFPVATAQIAGNAFDQRLLATQGLASGIAISLRSVFLQGLLLMDYSEACRRMPAAAPALTVWQDWCRAEAILPLEAALAIAKGLPGVRDCIVGVDSIDQLEQIADAWSQAQPRSAPGLAVNDTAIIDPRNWATAA